MKKRAFQLVSLLLLGILLFTQAGADFFHDHHELHTSLKKLSQSKASSTIEKGYDSCKICSLEFLTSLFFQEIHHFAFMQSPDDLLILHITDVFHSFLYIPAGRGPPVL